MRNNIYKRALLLSIPMMLQNGITNMVTLVDNLMVASLGTETITAVSIVGQLIFVFNLAIFGGLSGPGIYGAQYFGQGNIRGFQNTVRLKFWIGLVCCILGCGILGFGGEQLIMLYIHGENQNMDASLTLLVGCKYLNIMLLGLFPFVITQVYATSMRETGESFLPMIAGIVSVAIDVGFNYILIYGKFGCPQLGVKGAAIATVIARFVEMFLVVFFAHIFDKRFSFVVHLYSSLLVPKKMCQMMIRKGLPIFFNEFLWAGAIAALTQAYSLKGLEYVAGLNISNVLCNLLNVVFVAMGTSVGILIGQTLGEGKFEQAKKDAFHLAWFTAGMCLLLSACLVGLSDAFPKLYNVSEQVQTYGSRFIIITAIFFPVQGLLNALYFTLRSGGKTVVTFLFDSVYSWCFTLPIALLLCLFSSLSIFQIYALVQAADIIKVMIGYVLIKKGTWISNIVED